MFDQLGGEAPLQRIIDTFVERVFEDVMIGYMFANTNKARLKTLEYQHAARLLGADVIYEGRPLQKAHHRHAIMGGQFSRRKQILREVLEENAVPQAIMDAWLLHTEQLRDVITAGKECIT